MPGCGYRLQMKKHSWDSKWITLAMVYDTLEEAKAALAERKPASMYRIVQEYRVIRYRPIKV